MEATGFGPDPFLADPFAGGRAGFTATGEINRMDFGVSYNGPIPGGGVALGEQVQLVLEIQAARDTETAWSAPSSRAPPLAPLSAAGRRIPGKPVIRR